MSARIVTLICTVVFILFLAAFPLQAQTTWYVDDDAPNDPGPGDPSVSDPLEDGSTAHPFDAIQEAIDASSGGDTVQVADGTYTGDGNRDLDYGGKAITVMSENGAEQCIIDCQGGESNPHRGFNFHSGEGSSSVVHGFTIRNGYSSGGGGGIHCVDSSPTIAHNIITENTAQDYGGGINCNLSSSPAIINNSIANNTANHGGGGINCYLSSPTITENTLSGNISTTGAGGGINCQESFPLIIINTITSNNAINGGGIWCQISDPIINSNSITNNTAQNWGGGINCHQSSPTITENIINGNVALTKSGGGIMCNTSFSIISSNTISDNNSAGNGGGISCFESSPIIVCNILSGNTTNNFGGGINCNSSSTPPISNNIIKENTAYNGGAGIHCYDSSPSITNNFIVDNIALNHRGGGIWCSQSSPTINGNTIVGNNCNWGGGGIHCNQSSPTIINCILWGDTQPEINVESGDPIVMYSDVQGGWAGTGNINVDPLFVTGPEGVYYLSQVTAGQASNSPCLNAGSDPAANICFEAGCMEVCMDLLTTRTDHVSDSGMVDMGYHYGYSSEWCTVSTSLTCQPSIGTVPFSTQMAVTIENLYAGQIRRISARINVTLAGGAYYGNWRAGFTNVTAGCSYSSSWLQNIPALGSLIGPNLFELEAEDVTPAPYNQPPYPPAGDTDTATCTVTGIAP